MATQSLTEENSDLSENEDVQEIEDPILVAVNAGASLRSPTSAVIARKRKLPANEGKYKQRGSSKTTVRTSGWDRITKYPKHHFAVVNRKLRCNACSEIISEKKSSMLCASRTLITMSATILNLKSWTYSPVIG